MAQAGLWFKKSFTRQTTWEKNLLKYQKGHRVHPGVQGGPCDARPSCGVWSLSKVTSLGR